MAGAPQSNATVPPWPVTSTLRQLALPPPRSLDAFCSIAHIDALVFAGGLTDDELWPVRVDPAPLLYFCLTDMWGQLTSGSRLSVTQFRKDSLIISKFHVVL